MGRPLHERHGITQELLKLLPYFRKRPGRIKDISELTQEEINNQELIDAPIAAEIITTKLNLDHHPVTLREIYSRLFNSHREKRRPH